MQINSQYLDYSIVLTKMLNLNLLNYQNVIQVQAKLI